MNYLISAVTDAGIVRENNEDCVMVQEFQTSIGSVVLAVLCDGMGGLSHGDVASSFVVRRFQEWGRTELSVLCQSGIQDGRIRKEWESLVDECNAAIRGYGTEHGIQLGTTLVAFLLTPYRFYILNIGDSRAYEITDQYAQQLTEDQSFVNREVKSGRITKEQAKTDARRNILLQCIGVKAEVIGDFYFGTPKPEATYILCSDGFYHEITTEEMVARLGSGQIMDCSEMDKRARYLFEMNKYRGEKDNMTVAMVRTWGD